LLVAWKDLRELRLFYKHKREQSNICRAKVEEGIFIIEALYVTTQNTNLMNNTDIIITVNNNNSNNNNMLVMGKPEGKRPLGRPRRRWMDNIRTDLGEVGCGDVDWIGLAQDRNRWRSLVNSVLNLRVS
jgi:hypothetical protein